MKNWALPIAVLGISGLGLLFASERGRSQLKLLFERLANTEGPLGEFNDVIEKELDQLQRALDHLSKVLQT